MFIVCYTDRNSACNTNRMHLNAAIYTRRRIRNSAVPIGHSSVRSSDIPDATVSVHTSFCKLVLQIVCRRRFYAAAKDHLVAFTERTDLLSIAPIIYATKRAQLPSILHCVPKNDHICIFLNNSVKNEPILIIFGILNPEGT